MSFSHRLSDSLRRALGDEAAEEFVGWMDEMDLRRDTLRGDMAEFRQDVQSQLATIRQEIRDGDAMLSDAIKQARFDLVLWSFVFWVGAVSSIALLARALR